MKIAIKAFVFTIFLCPHTFAKTLHIPEHIFHVKTKVVNSSSAGRVSYRAIVISEGSEGGYRILIEKFKRGEEGAVTTVLMTFQTSIYKIDGFKEFIDEISQKSPEAFYGCCEPTNILWNDSNELHFKLFYTERLFKKGTNQTSEPAGEVLHTFHCESTSLDQYKVDLKCKEL